MEQRSEQERKKELARSYRESGEVLIQDTRPKLVRLARKLGLDLAAAKDVVHHAFVQLLDRRPRVGDVEAWLVTAVTRRSRDWKRKESFDSGVCPTTLPEEPIVELSPDQRLAVRAVLDRLPKRHRRLVEARYLEGHSEAEAARLAGYSAASFKKTMTRALAEMRAELERGTRAVETKPSAARS